jgi:hypothetical protein
MDDLGRSVILVGVVVYFFILYCINEPSGKK